MASVEWTNEGRIDLIDTLESAGGLAGLRLDLYTAPTTPDENSVLADFAVATFPSYAQATPSFGAAALINGQVQVADSAARTFSPSGTASETVRGYLVSNSSSGKSWFFQPLDSPLDMSVAQPDIEVTAWFALGPKC